MDLFNRSIKNIRLLKRDNLEIHENTHWENEFI
jgi:hypothetical protein